MKILLIAPYADLVATAKQVISSLPYRITVLYGDLEKGLAVAQKELMRDRWDILISRGGTASLLRKHVAVPVFDIDVTSYDLLRAVYPHAGVSGKIAVIGYENVVSGARSIAEIIGVELGYYLVDRPESVPALVQRAREWGAEVIVGDAVSVAAAHECNLKAELVRSGPEAVRNAVETAARFYDHMQDELIQNRQLHTIMEHSGKGVLYVSDGSLIELVNTRAERILDIHREQILGTHIEDGMIPQAVWNSLTEKRTKRLIKIAERDYIIEVYPIATDVSPGATLIFLQSTGYVRDLEALVRRQMTSRGLVAEAVFSDIISRNVAFIKIIEKARRYSGTDSTVLLLGDTGCGKEIFAQSIHNASPRKDAPFVGVNCAALPDTLLESELFGYVDGAFTGAKKGGKPGLFEMAHTGTIFLDEVNDMSAAVQARLLRVLQEKRVMRIGDNKISEVDVRIIAASNKNMFVEIEEGRFRKDLFYRLKILDIEIPPLKNRPEDIVPLFGEFLKEFKGGPFSDGSDIPPRLADSMLNYPWPGNVRELKNFAEKVSVVLTLEHDFDETIDDLITELTASEQLRGTLKDMEGAIIRECWERNGKNISKAAQELGIDRATLRKRLGAALK